MTILKREIRSLASSFSQASPQQITQIVATIDAMAKRGAADALVAPLRHRLPALGITRPLDLRRLGFEPLDALIVDGAAWRRGTALVPRTCLAPLFNLMREGCADLEQAELLLDRIPQDIAARNLLASLLWRHGAAALQNAVQPPDWRESTGLSNIDFTAICSIVACMLSQADRLRALDRHAAPSQTAEQLCEILEATMDHGALAWQAMLIRLCGDRHFASPAARIAQKLAGESASRPELAQALDPAFACARDLWESEINALHLSGRLSPNKLADMAEIVLNLASDAGPRSERKRAADHLRREANRICTQSVARILDEELLPALQPSEPQAGQKSGAEQAARAARSFCLIGQGLGAGEKYDAQMRPLIDRLADPASDLPPIDRARLLEILGKNTLALEVLKSCRPNADP